MNQYSGHQSEGLMTYECDDDVNMWCEHGECVCVCGGGVGWWVSTEQVCEPVSNVL